MKKHLAVLSLFSASSLLFMLVGCSISSWSTYTNATYGFQLQYPAGGTVVSDGPTAARIQLPITPDTNLVEKYLDIEVEPGRIPCLSPYGFAYGGPPGEATVTGEQIINGIHWTLESASEGAAGSFYEWTAYSTYGNGGGGEACVSLTFVLHSTNPMVYETPPPTFDEPAESLVFPTIVNTFSWWDLASPTSVPPGSWLTYTNQAYGFELQYPPGGGGLQPGDTAVSARIDLPFAPGTSLVEKYLAIEVEDGGGPCGPTVAPGDPTPVPGFINGLEWLRENGGEGAAGSMFVWTAYWTVSGSVCVGLSFVLHSESPDVDPTPAPDYDADAEKAVFLEIVETFVWLDGAAVTPTLVPTSTATPTLVPSSTATPTPTPVAFFFIPKMNLYCRLGPDPIFESFDYAMKGQSYRIDGRNLMNTWLYIMLTPNSGCWVPADAGTASADTSLVRVLRDIPTPTFTPPPPVCSQYLDEKSCETHPECTWALKQRVCENK